MNKFPSLLRQLATPLLCAVVLTVLSSTPAHGQGGIKVTSIEVQYTGPETISREAIRAQMRTAVGKEYSDAIAEQDIRNLYKTGQVQNVRIFGQQEGAGVKVIVAVQTRATVNQIEIEGATRISAKALRKKIKLKVNSPVDEDALGAARQEILDAYRAKGFNDVDVQFRVDTDAARGTSRVVYTINEGAKGSISDIRFEGNNAFKDRILRKQMKTKRKTIISFLDKSGRLDEAQLQQDLDAVREWYQDHGYIDVALGDIRRERGNGRMEIVVPVSEGTKYRVGRISVKGQKLSTEAKTKALMKLKEGAVYSPKVIREDAKRIADAYGAGGYVDLVITPQGTPTGPAQIDVTYTVEEGERSFVQRINVTGNTRTKDKVIRREVLIAPGDVFNTVRVETTKKRLDNLGYFSRVETYPEETGVNGRKDLTVQVEEKRTGSLNFGAGFSSVDSIVGFAEITQGNFDLMNWPNFTGGGQKFRARVQLGSERQDFTVSLTEPFFLDRRLSLGGDVFYRRASFLSDVFEQRNYGFSVLTRKGIGRFVSVSLEYRLEEIDIFDVARGASEAIQSEKGARTKSQITTSLVFDTRDNPFLTRTGQRIVLTPFVSGGFLQGDTQLFGFDLEASQYFHLPYDLILLLNGRIASVGAWGKDHRRLVEDPEGSGEFVRVGNRVPIFDRLFLGGANDLRGFDFRDVGPKDEDGEPLGGQSLARATVELTFPIIEKVRAAVFSDIGFVEPKSFNAGGRPASDVGLGLRLDLPIGPLRLDYAFPVQTGGNNDRSGNFNFNVGYQF